MPQRVELYLFRWVRRSMCSDYSRPRLFFFFCACFLFSGSGFHTYVCQPRKVFVFTGSHACVNMRCPLFSFPLCFFSPSFSVNFLLNVEVAPFPFLALVAYYEGVFFTFFFFCRASLRAFLPLALLPSSLSRTQRSVLCYIMSCPFSFVWCFRFSSSVPAFGCSF